MENASKALLIAAGVLIVILIVTLGIKIFSSSSSNAEDAQKVGESIASGVHGAATSIDDEFDKLDGYDEINRYEDQGEVEVKNYYNNYLTNIRLEEGKTYKISFDYKILSNPGNLRIQCGIGFKGSDNAYKDFKYGITYPDYKTLNKKMKFEYIVTVEKDNFTFIESYNNYVASKDTNNGKYPYLYLRLARVDSNTYPIKVEITNLKITTK